MIAVDLFGGPGGLDAGARDLGIDPVGVENDEAACATRDAAGLQTIAADVAALDPADHPCDLLIGAPPCPPWSRAGKGGGRKDVGRVWGLTRMMARGEPIDHPLEWTDPRSRLVIEPLRWALALRPAFVVLEQVPPVLGYWELCGGVLRDVGYSAWAGILSAERYGVPQTRQRAFLIASRDGEAAPPPATHQRFVPGEGKRESLGGELLPWVSMADALGWGMTDRPYPVLASGRTTGGPDKEKVGGAAARAVIYAEKDAGRWVDREWFYRNGNQPNAARRRGDEPAPTLHFGHALNSGVEWTTTPDEPWTPDTKGISITLEEAAVLQGFPADYPWQGSRTAQFRQIGDAVPPPMARAVLASVTGIG